MPRPSIAVLTFTDDLHALVIQAHLRRNRGALCEVVEVDTMADRPGGLSWSTDPGFGTSVPTRDGGRLDLAGCDAIWFRRWNHPQRAGRELSEPAHREVVDASCASTLMGALRNEFDGRWVSHPDATRRAENKLIQLRAATDAGFVVPRTWSARIRTRSAGSARCSTVRSF
ncbi:ATP-grasp domain-containing protein [Kribbella jiaozuonensis]|uniref:Uncharacterized protein n=1 Tax=Kribbella jiaozuonensis TaxID=2575441 RepID=A0A4U3LXJ1_9ACTN|nr:hypothetical protein [Kribbella jiaozuonensis]TKK79606.1 hypothetical protein FDA38_14515 [Kribbella jiaozuonensis]